MARYAIVDQSGTTRDIIIWDGQTPFEPPENCMLVPEKEAAPLISATSSSAISALAFFNRFTPAEQAAISAACLASPQLNAGLVNGLASGVIDLGGAPVSEWLDGLIAAGAIDVGRKSIVLEP